MLAKKGRVDGRIYSQTMPPHAQIDMLPIVTAESVPPSPQCCSSPPKLFSFCIPLVLDLWLTIDPMTLIDF
jgi:hypothetical protein